MCGIFFYINKKTLLNQTRCINSLKVLNERGPDNSFYKIYKNIFLGQTTLTITSKNEINLDKIHRSADNKFDILFNGEIYNYLELRNELINKFNCKIKSNSDTEVLVNLFSYYNPTEVIKKISGMYAFILYDKINNKIFFSRDHIGEKILYIYNKNDEIIISSEIKPIKILKEKLDLNILKLKEYFHTRHLITNNETCFKEINTVKPGLLYEYDITKNIINDVYDHSILNLVNKDNYNNFSSLSEIEIFRECLERFRNGSKAITPKINYASVCSGGVDSSLVSALVNENDYKPSTFIAINFNNKDKSFKNITNLENKININVDKLNIDVEKYASIIDKVYTYNFSPLATHSFISQYFVSEYCKNNNLKVLLTGDGGDELFGGYELYKKLQVFDKIPNLPPSNYSNLQYENIFFDNEVYENQVDILSRAWEKIHSIYNFIENIDERVKQSTLLLDSYLQLESVGIRSSDMMGMINSIESRSLFLLKDIVSLALNLPQIYKINHNEEENLKTKTILKKLLILMCNESSVVVKKDGFSGFPNEAGKIILKNENFKNTKDLLKISDKFDNLIRNNRSLEWKFINIELFLRNYN